MNRDISDLTDAERKARLQSLIDNYDNEAFKKLLAEAWDRPEVLAEKNSEKQSQLAHAFAGFHDMPPSGVCTNMMQTTDTYCCRKLLLGSVDCYWHSIRTDKGEPSVIAGYFENGQTIGHAMAVEVKAGRSLANIYLTNIGLSGANNLTGAVFTNSILTGVHFAYAALDSAMSQGANLEGSNLAQCSLRNVNFVNANLYMAKFRHNHFDGAIGLSKIASVVFVVAGFRTILCWSLFQSRASLYIESFVRIFLLRAFSMTLVGPPIGLVSYVGKS